MQEKKDEKEDRCWLLVSLKLSGEATPEELSELASLVRDHPEWSLRIELFTNVWRQKIKKNPGVADFNRHVQRLSTHLANPVLQYEDVDRPQTHFRRLAFRSNMAIAAVIIGATLLLSLYKYMHRNSKEEGCNSVTTRPGSRSRLQLPDGTLVWLNADSRLTYKMDNESRLREVNLAGEAYFDVARDKDRPFLIHTSTIDIRVLGTSFNVQCYGNDRHTETSLFAGSVEVSLKNNPGKKIMLRPSEKLIIQNNEIAVTRIKTNGMDSEEPLVAVGKVHYQQQDSSYTEMLWTKNKLAFDDRTLEDVAHQIERWYGVKVTITDEQLKATRFSGVLEDEELLQVMEALQMTGDFHYSIHKREVTITP